MEDAGKAEGEEIQEQEIESAKNNREPKLKMEKAEDRELEPLKMDGARAG